MTLADMATYVTAKLGQTDATSVSMCKDFIRRRYDMVWNAFPWKDSQIFTSTTISNSTASIQLPTGTERIISIRAGGNTFLEPIDSVTLLQLDPQIIEREGTPVYYSESYDYTASKRIVSLYPIPAVTTALYIVGKRAMLPLTSDGDSPVLRNLDNCLMAFAQADMLQRQRQYAKAKELVEEGAALLEAAKKVELEQAALPRRTKTTSVTGDTLAEMRDAVCAKTGFWAQDSRVLVDEFIRRNYLRIYDGYLWPESKVRISKASDGSYIILPSEIAQVIKVRYGAGWPAIDVVDESLYFDLSPGIFEETATQPAAYSVLTPIGATVLPTVAEKLQVVSSSSSDKGSVFIRGETATGSVFTESVTLNGTTPVAMASTLLIPLTIAKKATVGTITVTGYTSGTTYQTLLPAETEKKHIRLMVQPSNFQVATTCLILGKRHILPLQADEDTPIIRGIGDALINAAAADLLKSKGQGEQAASYAADSQKAVASLIDQFTQQAAYSQQVVPVVEPLAWDGADSDAWIVAKI